MLHGVCRFIEGETFTMLLYGQLLLSITGYAPVIREKNTAFVKGKSGSDNLRGRLLTSLRTSKTGALSSSTGSNLFESDDRNSKYRFEFKLSSMLSCNT